MKGEWSKCLSFDLISVYHPVHRMPVLEPRHKIFISHSGAEKDFVDQLCVDLEQRHHNPFFDKRPDSLPKGEKFPSLIFQAAEQCWVAVLVLSKDFFIRSKWPMLELVACIEAKKKNPQLKILPLFYRVSLKELKDESFERLCYLTWTEWRATDPRVHPFNWRNALQAIYSSNGIQFDGQGAVLYRRRVVEAVCRLVPPNVNFDDSFVQGKERLCQVYLWKWICSWLSFWLIFLVTSDDREELISNLSIFCAYEYTIIYSSTLSLGAEELIPPCLNEMCTMGVLSTCERKN